MPKYRKQQALQKEYSIKQFMLRILCSPGKYMIKVNPIDFTYLIIPYIMDHNLWDSKIALPTALELVLSVGTMLTSPTGIPA